MPSYNTWATGTDQERKKLAWENIQNNPQIVAAWLHLQFNAFYKHVLLPYFKVHDYWYQYKWQARGIGHIHAIIWIDNAPKMGGIKKEEVRARFAAFWADYITAVNPDTCRPLDIRNPASLA
jgi:hypothetical protein